NVDDALGATLLAIAALTVGWAAWHRTLSRGERMAGATALCGLVACLILPTHLLGQYYVAARMAPWVFIAAVPLASPVSSGRTRAWVTLAYALGAVATLGVHHATLHRFDAESAPARKILAEIPDDQRVILWARRH